MNFFRKKVLLFTSLLCFSCLTSCGEPVQGLPGVDGKDGEDGSKIYTDFGEPFSSIGKVGDIYIDTNTGDIYTKDNTGRNKTGNIKGNSGENGKDGADGKDGLSIVKTYIDDNGDLICEMSDGEIVNAGHIKEVNKCTVNFYIDDELIDSQTVQYNQKICAPDENKTKGYSVKSWNCKKDDEYKWLFSVYTVTENLDLYASFSYNTYTISYKDSKFNNSYSSLNVTYDKKYSLLKLDDVDGYSFGGWKMEDGEQMAATGIYRIPNNITLEAIWIADNLTITLNPNDGVSYSMKLVVTYGSVYELPTLERENYIFVGWYDSEGNKISSKATCKILENVTYIAKWTNVLNTYTLDAGDGKCDVDTITIDYESPYNLPIPTAPKGYVFFGWYLDGKRIDLKGDNWTFSNIGELIFAKYFSLSDDVSQNEYGVYPQTHISDSTVISELEKITTAESNGWYLYNNTYYAKLTAKPYDSNYKFDDNTTIVSGTTYWFKCEPITWKIIESDNGIYTLLSNVLLDAHMYDDSSNNYANSEIREWLNGTFYNSAFSLDDSLIQTTLVDNSASTTYSSSNSYACENTNDKIYLLSYRDYLKSEYGFTATTSSTNSRICKTTDYARANGAYYYTSSSYLYNGYYRTRSPSSSSLYFASNVYVGGILSNYYSVDITFICVRPSLQIKVAD